MATDNSVFGEVDDHEEYLVVLAKEAKEALLDRKVKEMQKKNRDILKRHAEVEADRKAAEDSGCAVTVKSNQQSQSDHCEMQSEAPKIAEEDVPRRRGQSQGWGRGRPRASRFRPGHHGQGSLRDNNAAESDVLEDKDSEKRLSPSYAGNEKHLPSGDWDTGPPSYSSTTHPLESQSRPPNGGQKSREPSRGQRVMSGRGHSRGPFAKFVTVPDASHSHDVRHVEEVNNSIVINIDRSTRLGGDSTRRGGGRSTGVGSGYSAQSNPTGELLEDSVRDQEPFSDNAQHQKSGYQGQGRRPFRGRADGSFRGRGESSFRGQGQGRGDKFRRGRGDGPRPFRGGYRDDRARGGRASRRAVIVTSKSERGDSSQQVPEPEDWDKIVPAGDTAVEADAIDGHGWTKAEDGSANWDEGEGNHDPDRSKVVESDRSYKESHKELDLHEGEEVAHQDQPEELEHHTVEQSENHSGGMGHQPKTGLTSKDESISTQAEHSPSCTKPCEMKSALPLDTTEGDFGIHAVEKLTEKPCDTLSALPVEATKDGLGIHAVEKLTEKPCATLSALQVEARKDGLGIHAVEKLTEKPCDTLSALPVEATKSGLGIHAVEKLTEKPCDTLSALPVEATKSGLGIHAVEKLTEKPCDTLSALPVEATKDGLGIHAVEKLTEKSSSNIETVVESKPHKLNTVSKAADVENPSSYSNDSHELVPEKVAETANGESKDAIKPCNVEVAGAVDLQAAKNDSLGLVPEKAVSADLKRSDHEMFSSNPVPSVSVAAAAATEVTVTSIQPKAPANVLTGESISAEPQSPDSDMAKKPEAVNSEIPASVKENT